MKVGIAMKTDLLTPDAVADEPSIVVVRTTAPKIPIYRWSGEYFGFIHKNNFFDATSNYLGWLDDDGCVWRSNGAFLGRLVDGNYILKLNSSIDPTPKPIPPLPSSPVPPFPEPNRVWRILPFDSRDALDCF
jgi:hypothetical protein